MPKSKSLRSKKKGTRRRNIRGGMWPFTSSKNEESSTPEPKSLNVFDDKRLSTQPNEDPSYEDSGIIHATDAVGINFGRAIVTNIANAFGSKGIDLSRYNLARTGVLKKLLKETPPGYKVCNIKMDIENTPQSVHVHAYGSLMKPKSSSSSREREREREENDDYSSLEETLQPKMQEEMSPPPMQEPQQMAQPQMQQEPQQMQKQMAQPQMQIMARPNQI
jgi:hypothetical protein